MKCKRDFPTLPMPELRLYHSPKKCAKFIGRHGVPFEPNESADAQTWTFEDDGRSYAVVLYDCDQSTDYWDDIGMLAHEATHVMLFAFGEIGEEEPAEEEMCYVVQALTTWLCEAHLRWKERHKERSRHVG